MQALTLAPYYLALAHGNVRLNLQIGIASVALITPLLIYLITRYAVVGAGLSWLIMNLCTLPPYMYLLHRRFLSGGLRTWVVSAVLRPLLAAFPIVLLARLFLPVPPSRLPTLGLIGLVWVLSAGAGAFSSPEFRAVWNRNDQRWFWRLSSSIQFWRS